MKKIYTAANPADAHIVRGILESYEIGCEVRGESLFSVRGELPMVGDTFPTVWIFNDEDFEEARKVVDEIDRKREEAPVVSESWNCSRCGETLESQFTACWKCGKSRKTEDSESNVKRERF
ncbi:DUF2007 domain-containing protein [Desulfosediminicola flagellatus]|uniref:putative signal transducing protein n=1 Tax=Desulfosediminicola flagellatus TaxID=2569541 RepID=UPI0010AC116D|nr:DUF2007 domain-containing protein [Desulfosediminicola flagellatus]